MPNYLTINEIEELSAGLVRVFYGKQQTIPQAVDIDSFVTKFLKLPVEYHTFAETDSDKIGFIADGVTALGIYQNGARAVVFPRGTIVLEKALLHPLEENRRRFTLAHEASHYLIDRTISTALFRRECANAHPCSTQELRKLFTFHERQIDRMAAAILMPKFIMENILSLLTAQNPITIYGDNLISAEDKLLVQKMATMMCVSYTAFFIRLKELGLHHRRSTEEYIIEQMCLRNGGISQ